MPKRLTKREHDDEVYKLWRIRLCMFGLRQAKKIIYDAYKELRRQENERKKVTDDKIRR
jgi:hypothetical protein